MRMRTLAPVAMDFYLVPGATLRDPQAYADFWKQAQPRLEAVAAGVAGDAAVPPTVRCEHGEVLGTSRYRDIGAQATGRPLHLITLTLQQEHLDRCWESLPQLMRGSLTSCEVRLFDHGIAVMETALEIPPDLATVISESPEQLKKLSEQVVSFGEMAAGEAVRRYLAPVLASLRAADDDHEIVHEPDLGGAPTSEQQGVALWVTRSLVVAPGEAGLGDLTRHWLADVATDPSDLDAMVTGVEDGTVTDVVRWLNYLFVQDEVGQDSTFHDGPFSDTWAALRGAQFYYAALDRVDSRLSQILADAAAAQSRVELADLQEQLVTFSQRAELVIMDRQEVSKYLKRSVRQRMDAILAGWDHEQLVEKPIRFKIAVGDRRLAELGEQRSARSAMWTDVILLGIGVTSVLGTALALTEFGRTMISDPSVAGFDLGRSVITQWFAAQPADAVIIAGAGICALLVALYFYFRRES